MILNLVEEIKMVPDITYTIHDDGSDYTLDDANVICHEHGGKEKYWKLWNYALDELKTVESDIFVFLPNDFVNINFNKIKELHGKYKHVPYCYHIINDGRVTCWSKIPPEPVDEETTKIGFCDCGFFCNREALDKIGYYMPEVDLVRFKYVPTRSSGVGQELTLRMNNSGVSMFRPIKSLAYHGDHDSLMNYEERKNIPLKSL